MKINVMKYLPHWSQITIFHLPGYKLQYKKASLPFWKSPSVETWLINQVMNISNFQNGWDIKALPLYATSSGSNVLLENSAWQIVTVCLRTQQRQQLCYERAGRVKEYFGVDGGVAGEGHCGLVKKPLLPDVHLNKELFPVAVYLFFFI